MSRPAPDLAEMHHVRLCCGKDHYCGHPRQSGIYNFGAGELAVLHSHAPCAYREPEERDRL